MSTSLTGSPRPATARRFAPGRWMVGVGLAALVVVAAGVGLAVVRRGASATSGAVAPPDEGGPGPDPRTTVVLPEGKRKAAGIEVGAARRTEQTTEVGVAGLIAADADHRVEVRPRVTGVIRRVDVALGRKVRKGETLVVLESPEIGTARLNLRARQRELATARYEAGWKRQVAANVDEIIPLLRKDTPARHLAKLFADKPLGSFRGEVLGSYSEYEIAEHEEEKQDDMNKQGLVGEHPVFFSRHNRDAKQAVLESRIEQGRHDASLQARVADQAVRTAEADVIDAAQRLRVLGVEEDLARAIAPEAAALAASTREYEDVTAYPIVAPFDGTIVARSAVVSRRVEPTDGLLTLVDLTTVRVSASVPESALGLLPRLGVPTVRLTAEAYPGRTFEAKVIYAGAEVDPATRTVSLLAELPNPDGQLRPGMFARIILDSDRTTSALTVPAGAVVEVDGRAGVFRPGTGPASYVFTPVVAGPEANGRRPIAGGLAEGDPVVIAGAFLLKSELVLQNETGDD